MSGEITSWRYPQNYTDNLRCVYHIEVPYGYHICLYFEDYDMGSYYDLFKITTQNEYRLISDFFIHNLYLF